MSTVAALRWRGLILIQASFAARCSGRMAVSQQSTLQEDTWMNFSTQQHKHFGKRLANKANRAAVAEHFPDPRVRKAIEVDVSLLDHYDQLLGEVELYLTRSAKTDDVQTFARLQSVPGIGQILALVLLYEIHDIRRFPRVQDVVSYCRLVKCAKESSGKKLGTSGKKIGNVHLRWALAEAVILFIRQSQLGKVYFMKLESNHGKAQALTVLAHKLGRAVYYMLTREQAFDLTRFVAA
jgi:transposase